MSGTFFITTAIDYTNGAPHIGHAYEKVLADVLARYHRLKGDEVFFLTGVDQHGQKVQQSAEKQGVAPQEFVDGITAKFVALWDKLNVRHDGWAATTDALHKECVRANLQMLWDDKVPGTDRSRWIYKKTQRGFYSVRQEQFLTDKERGPDGEFGPEWQPVEEREEENFYFRLMQDPATGLPGFDPKRWLLDFIDQRTRDGKPFVIPDFRVAELRNAVEKLDGDLCISRPAARLQWGIPFPESFGAGFVTYVWFDALVNYISFVPGHDPGYAERMKDEGGRMKSRETAGNDPAAEGPSPSSLIPHPSSFSFWWPPLHVIGKDILIPAHGVYWPVMLKALGFTDEEMPTLLVHGWWNIRGKGGESEKMSKSLGNVVDPDVLADKYGAEAVRYYLVSDILTGYDADFSEDLLVQRYNTDLANSLGNLLNRALSMAAKYRAGILSARAQPIGLAGVITRVVGRYHKAMLGSANATHLGLAPEGPAEGDAPDSNFPPAQINLAINFALAVANICNKVVDFEKPWAVAKLEINDPTKAKHLDDILYTLAESLRIIAILLSPVLPKAAHGIFDQLNWKMDLSLGGTRSGASPSDGTAEAKLGEVGRGSPALQPPLFPSASSAGAHPSEDRFRLSDATWGGLPDGHQLGQPTPLFPRIEPPKVA
jgi:methionyl-tRNA synthetase